MATRCGSPIAPRRGRRAPGGAAHSGWLGRRTARRRHGRAHLHRRADPRRRRCGGDAGRHEALPEDGALGRVRIDAAPAAGPVDPPRRRRRAPRAMSCWRAANALTPAGAGPGGQRRASTGCRSRARRASRCCRPATNWSMPGEVAPDAMKPGAIYNSNRFFMRALLHAAGLRSRRPRHRAGPARRHDRRSARRRRRQRPDHHHRRRLGRRGRPHQGRRAGARELDLWSLSMKPGKPFAYGRIGNAHVTGLPGNPVSSFLTFLLLVRPVPADVAGRDPRGARAGRDARRLRLAAGRPAPRVPARAPQRRKAGSTCSPTRARAC